MYGTRRRVELGGHLYIKIKTGEASKRITCNTKVWKKGMDSRHRFRISCCLLLTGAIVAEYNYVTSYNIQMHVYTRSHTVSVFIDIQLESFRFSVCREGI